MKKLNPHIFAEIALVTLIAGACIGSRHQAGEWPFPEHHSYVWVEKMKNGNVYMSIVDENDNRAFAHISLMPASAVSVAAKLSQAAGFGAWGHAAAPMMEKKP